MARNGEYYFMHFLAIWISFFEKVLISLVVHFFIGLLILGEFTFLAPRIFWLSVLYLVGSQRIFSPLLWVVFSV
jgi:hypothetical protein